MNLSGEIAAAQADWPKARAAFETLLKDFPDSKQRLLIEFRIAESFYVQHDYDSAAKKLEPLADEIVHGRPEAWLAIVPLRRAQIFALQNRWDDAYQIAAGIEKAFPISSSSTKSIICSGGAWPIRPISSPRGGRIKRRSARRPGRRPRPRPWPNG